MIAVDRLAVILSLAGIGLAIVALLFLYVSAPLWALRRRRRKAGR